MGGYTGYIGLADKFSKANLHKALEGIEVELPPGDENDEERHDMELRPLNNPDETQRCVASMELLMDADHTRLNFKLADPKAHASGVKR